MMQRDRDDSRAEMEQLQATDTARDTEIARLRSENADTQQTIDLFKYSVQSGSTELVQSYFRANERNATSDRPPEPLWGLQ